MRGRSARRSRRASSRSTALGRSALGALSDHRRLALALTAALALLAGGWLWLRHSSLVAVERVQISGIAHDSPDARAIEAALARSSHGMSTLDVSTATLSDAVARFAIVRSLHARAIFPHGLRVQVVEQPPVAALEAGGSRTAVAADGVALGPGLLSASLPTVHASGAAAAILPLAGRGVRGVMLRAQLAVLGAAPRVLARLITGCYSGPQGVTIVLAGRVRAYFGDATTPHAKWLSLARVLADPSSAGASYVDVRVPERPAAGFAPGVAHAGAGSEAEPSSASDPTTAAALAAGLEAAVAGGLSSTASTTPTGGESEVERLDGDAIGLPVDVRRSLPERAPRPGGAESGAPTG